MTKSRETCIQYFNYYLIIRRINLLFSLAFAPIKHFFVDDRGLLLDGSNLEEDLTVLLDKSVVAVAPSGFLRVWAPEDFLKEAWVCNGLAGTPPVTYVSAPDVPEFLLFFGYPVTAFFANYLAKRFKLEYLLVVDYVVLLNGFLED